MRNTLIILVLCVFAIWGYFLMGQLDRFLHAHAVDDDSEPFSQEDAFKEAEHEAADEAVKKADDDKNRPEPPSPARDASRHGKQAQSVL